MKHLVAAAPDQAYTVMQCIPFAEMAIDAQCRLVGFGPRATLEECLITIG